MRGGRAPGARPGISIAILLLTVLAATVAPVAAGAQDEPRPGRAVINEIHHHPEDPWGDAEFVELHNPGDTPVNLGGTCWTDGISGCFPDGTILEPGGFVVATKDAALHAQRFPTAPQPAMEFGGSLSNRGERITLTAADGETILDSVEYEDRGDQSGTVAPHRGVGPPRR